MQNTTDGVELNNQLVALREKLLSYLEKFPERKWAPFEAKAYDVIIVGERTLCVKFKGISQGLQPMEVNYIEFMGANNLKEEDLTASN